MKNLILKLTSIILIAVFVIVIAPIATRAAEGTEGVILEKTTGEKIIYLKGMDSTEFKYAFSNNESDAQSASYITATKDSNNEYVANMAAGETYKYMFIQEEENTTTVELNTFKSIKEKEIEDVEKLTKIIKISAEESDSTVSNNNGTTVTTTTGKIVIKDDGDYQYQLIEIVDKNSSTSTINPTALELYNQLSALANAEKMYDKLVAEVKIRDDFKKLIDDATWKDAKNKTITQPKDSQEGEKFVVLIREVEDGDPIREDVQFMTCDRKDAEGVEETQRQVEKKTKLPVTGENLALYIIFGIIILAIIILIVRMRKAKNDEE